MSVYQSLIRPLLKNGRDALLYCAGQHRFRSVAGESLLVLTYHRVLSADSPALVFEQPGMYVTPETFENHLKWLGESFDFVRLNDWLNDANAGNPLPRKACAISFDDGWLDNYQYAFPVMEKYGVPATMFLVSKYVGKSYQFWPGRVARLLADFSGGEIGTGHNMLRTLSGLLGAGEFELPQGEWNSAAVIDYLIGELKNFPDSAIDAALDQISGGLAMQEPQTREIVDWQEVRSMLASGLMDFGSHTVSHTRLTENLDQETIDFEVSVSSDMIFTELGIRPTLFCYPNGDVSSNAMAVVRERYLGACLTEQGWNGRKVDPFQVRRYNMHEDNTNTRLRFYSCIGR